MKKIIYLAIIIMIFLLSSCLKPIKSPLDIKVDIYFSTQTKNIIYKNIDDPTEKILLRLNSQVASFGEAYLKIIDIDNHNNLKTLELKNINQTTFSGLLEISDPGKYEIIGVFNIGGEEYTSKNKLYINVYDYKKELEPSLKIKNTETGNIIEGNTYEPYRNYSILVSIDSEIVYNSDFSYRIYFDSNLIEEGNIKNMTFESTPLFFKKKNHIISVEVFDITNNGFGRTTVEYTPKDIDTSFDLIYEIHKNKYNGEIIANDSTLTTIEPLYITLNINEDYTLPASYSYIISDNDGEIIKETTDKLNFKYGPIYLNNGNNVLKLYAKNLITNDSTETFINLKVEQFEEFDATLDIFKMDYMNKIIKIKDSSEITNKDPVYFKTTLYKNYDFSNDLNYSFLLKKDGIEYKKLDITTNSTILETDVMYLEEGNYQLSLTITKPDTNYSKEYHKIFKVEKVINNFNIDYSLIQRVSDNSTILYYLPEKIYVDPESTQLNDFDMIFNLDSKYTYPATYVYSIRINNETSFESNPVQTRNYKYGPIEFPKGHNYIEVSAKDTNDNYLITKNFEILVKENNPPELFRVSIEGTEVYSATNPSDFYDLEISSPISNPRIIIEFFDESEIELKNSLNISISIFENNITNETTTLVLAPDQKSKHIKFSGVLNGLTLDSTQTWEIKIDPSQIIDEFGNSYADIDDDKKKYYPIHFKTK